MENNQANISFKLKLDSSQLKQQVQTEVTPVFSGMGTALKNLGDRGASDLKKINDEALKAAKYFDEMARGIGLTTRELRASLDYWRTVESAIQKSVQAEEAANLKKIRDSDLLTRKLESDAERLLRNNLNRHEEERKNHKFLFDSKLKTEAEYAKSISAWQSEAAKNASSIRDAEYKGFIDKINKQNQALRQQSDLEKSLGKSIENRFGNQFKSTFKNLSGDGGFGGAAANLFSGGGMGGNILGSAIRGGSMASANGAGIGGLIGGIAGGAAIGAITAAVQLLISALESLMSVAQEGAKALFDYTASLEQVRIGFETLLGSADAASDIIFDLQQFASTSPFEFKGISDASRKLLAMGQDAGEIIPELEAIGNAVAALGGDNDQFQRIVKAFADIHARAKLTGEEIRQLANNLVPIIPILSKELKVSSAEVMKMTRDGKISADLFLAAFENFVSREWGTAMEKQSKTFLGSLGNVKDMLFVIGTTAFEPIFNEISKAAQKFNEAFQSANGVEGVLERSVALFGYYGGKFGAAMIDKLIETLVNPMTWVKVNALFASGIGNAIRGIYDQQAYDFGADEGDLLGVNWITKNAPSRNTLLVDNLKTRKDEREKLKEQMRLLDGGELGARQLQAQSKTNQSWLNDQLGQLSSYYRVSEAQLNRHLTFTREAEGKVDRAQTQNRLAHLRNQRDIQSLFFKEEESRYAGNSEKLQELMYQKSAVLSKIETDSRVERINLEKRELEREYAIFEEARQAHIKAVQLRITTVQTAASRENQIIEEALNRGSVLTGEGYARMRDVAVSSYLEQRRLVGMQFDAQLLDLKLTVDQRRNIETERNLELQKLSESHVQSLLDIEQRGFERSEQNLTNHSNRMKAIYSSMAEVFSAISAIVNPTSLNSETANQLNRALNIDVLIEPRAKRQAELAGLQSKRQSVVDRQSELANRINSLPNGLVKDASQGAYAGMTAQIDALNKEIYKVEDKLANLTSKVPAQYFNLSDITSQMLGGSKGIEGFDQLASELLKIKHLFEDNDLQADIDLVTSLIGYENAKKGSNPDEIARLTLELSKIPFTDEMREKRAEIQMLLDGERGKGAGANRERLAELGAQLKKLTNAQTTNEIRQQAEEIDRYNNSIEGLNDRIEKLRNRDRGTVLGIEDKTTRDALREQASILEENIALETRLKLITENSADVYRNAWLKAVNDVKDETNKLAAARGAADVTIARQTALNAEGARTQIAEYMASTKGYTEIFADSFTTLADTLTDSFGNLFGKVNEHLGRFGQYITNISSSLFKMVANRLIMRLVDWMMGGGNGGSGSGNALGVNIGTGGNSRGSVTTVAGGALQSVLTGGLRAGIPFAASGNAAVAAAVSGNGILNQKVAEEFLNFGGSGSSISASDTLSGQAASAISGAANLKDFGSIFKNGKFSIGGLGEMIAPMLPLAGLSLGSGLGGRSMTGSILGGASGLVLGGLGGLAALGGASASIFAAGGALSSLGGVASFLSAAAPIIAPLAIGGLILAKVLSRNAERRENEKVRTQLYTEANGQLDAILAQIQSSPSNAVSLLQQAEQVRQNYIDQAGKISDSKTKRIALEEAMPKAGQFGQIAYRMDKIRAAASVAANQNKYFNSLIPEFATGGTVLGQLGAAQLVLAHGGERIINRRQQTPEVMEALSNAGVPNTSQLAGDSGRSSGRNGSLFVELHIGTETQNQMFINGARSDQGLKVLVSANNSNRMNREY